MSFTIRPYQRFPVQCYVTYDAGPFQGQGIVWNLAYEYFVSKIETT